MTTTLPAWWKLAAAALTAARDKDYQAAAAAAQLIHDQHGPDVLPMVMLAWIDTTIKQCRWDPRGKPVAILWRAEDSTEITDADGTPPAAVWAGRLIGARLADDQDMFRAVLDSCSDAQWSGHVSALLTTCGAMLRDAATSYTGRTGG